MKRILSIILAVAMLGTMMVVPAYADGNQTITGTVRYYSGHDNIDQDFETGFTYSDDYFSQSAYIYRQDLAAASLAMAFGAFSSRDAELQVNEDQNWISFMNQCGFKNAASNQWYRKAPEHNSIGVCCGQKAITVNGQKTTLIAVGIRGNFYRLEWGGNMNIGASGDQAGWTLCKEQVLSYVSQYIADNNITGDVKLWIAGYSRSAATANLTAAELDEGYSLSANINLKPENIYCYCFEPPLPTVDQNAGDVLYRNIQNFVNENDVITYVPFDSWGFTRYGVDRVVASKGDSDYEGLEASMLEDFNAIENNGGSYMVDDFHFVYFDTSSFEFTDDYSVSQEEYYAKLSKAMAENFAFSREDYAENMQPYLVETMGIIFNRMTFDGVNTALVFAQKIQENYEDIMLSTTYLGAKKVGSTYDIISNLLFDSLNETNITQFTKEELECALKVLIPRLTYMAVKNPNVVATLLANATTIISAHYAELSMAWARTLPSDYMTLKYAAIDAETMAAVAQSQTGTEETETAAGTDQTEGTATSGTESATATGTEQTESATGTVTEQTDQSDDTDDETKSLGQKVRTAFSRLFSLFRR